MGDLSSSKSKEETGQAAYCVSVRPGEETDVGLPSNRPKPLNSPDWAAVPIAELPDATVDTLNDSILDDSF